MRVMIFDYKNNKYSSSSVMTLNSQLFMIIRFFYLKKYHVKL